MADWSPELKQEVIDKYLAAEPTPENTTEIVKDIAEELGDEFTPNGVRAILVKAEVYKKKATATAKGNGSAKGTRVNKATAINELSESIEAAGLDVDSDILGKLTGKAAVYFKEVFDKLNSEG